VYRPRVPTDNIDAALRTLTAFDSLGQLQAHVADGGKPPSFRVGAPGAPLGLALLEKSHPFCPLATLWE
jgi:hypothetical protein